MFADKKGIAISTLIAAVIALAVLILLSIVIYILAKKDFSLGELIESIFRFGGK